MLSMAGLLIGVLNAGNLNPPAPPTTGTMKTLNEVEPRIPIHQSDIPLFITEPNSYYLAENVTDNEWGECIMVLADDVTIDLNGFAISGSDYEYSYGIWINGCSNVEIRNGSIRDFETGIIETDYTNGKNHRVLGVRILSCIESGVYFRYCNNCRVEDCTIADGGTQTDYAGSVYAICVGDSSTVKNNSIYNYGISSTCRPYGIEAGSNCTVTANTIYDNGTSSTADYVTGIWTGYNCTVEGNTVYNNGNSAGSAMVYGIYAGQASVVTGNTVHSNGESAGDTVYGIQASYGCTVTENASYNNGTSAGDRVYGISCGTSSTVTKNVSYNNGTSASAEVYGISCSSGCTVTDNTANENGTSATGSTVYGLRVLTGGSVTGNVAKSNGNTTKITVYGIYLSTYILANNNAAYDNNTSSGGVNMYAGAGCVLGTNLAP